jgi:hypothetical protein
MLTNPQCRVLICGGYTTDQASADDDEMGGITHTVLSAVSSCDLWTSATNTWSSAASMVHPRMEFGMAVLVDGTVVAAGGIPQMKSKNNDVVVPMNSTEVYDVATDTWRAGPPMPAPRSNFPLVALSDGSAMAIGGYVICISACFQSSFQRFDVAHNERVLGG